MMGFVLTFHNTYQTNVLCAKLCKLQPMHFAFIYGTSIFRSIQNSKFFSCFFYAKQIFGGLHENNYWEEIIHFFFQTRFFLHFQIIIILATSMYNNTEKNTEKIFCIFFCKFFHIFFRIFFICSNTNFMQPILAIYFNIWAISCSSIEKIAIELLFELHIWILKKIRKNLQKILQKIFSVYFSVFLYMDVAVISLKNRILEIHQKLVTSLWL